MDINKTSPIQTAFEKLKSNSPTLSYEFFPPKNPAGWATLYSTLGEVAGHNLDFVSVTYGAGGTTREKTISVVGRIQNELDIETVPHLTCVDHSRDDLIEILDTIKKKNVHAIMALRGDPLVGQDDFIQHPDGLSHASELIDLIKSNYDFVIGCACYPEKHPDAASLEDDIEFLKLKQDKGADFAVTQLFFDNEIFYRFRDKAVAAGITIPLVAGIMPVSTLKQLDRFREMCGCSIPVQLRSFLANCPDDQVAGRGIDYGINQCVDLIQNDVAGIHLYTLNRAISSSAITNGLRFRGHFNTTPTDPLSKK